MILDLNCDLGEGCDLDGELMPLITSANVSCGAHAGDAESVHRALLLAKQHQVRVGAHPGFADRESFGRNELAMSQDQIAALCIHQVSALRGLADWVGVTVTHLKPHGALYNMACRDVGYAKGVIEAAEWLKLPIVALPGSVLEAQCKDRIPFIAEGFADRRYLPDGSLVPRIRRDAFVHDPGEAVEQARQLIAVQKIRTLCVHGDNPQALVFVKELRTKLTQSGVTIEAFA